MHDDNEEMIFAPERKSSREKIAWKGERKIAHAENKRIINHYKKMLSEQYTKKYIHIQREKKGKEDKVMDFVEPPGSFDRGATWLPISVNEDDTEKHTIHNISNLME